MTLLKKTLVFASLVALLGCASQRTPSYSDQVLNRPLPQTQEERDRECTNLRSEIARQNTLGAYGASTAGSPMMALLMRSAAEQNIAALSSRASQVRCNAAFGSSVVVERGAGGFSQQCMDSCKANTSRTGEQCFDACNK